MGRERALPLYIQVADTIQARIRNREFRPGDLIPSARELAEEYRVSNITIRKAIDLLTSKGYLSPRQGLGTRVARDDGERVEIAITGQFREWLDSATGKSLRLKAVVLDHDLAHPPWRVQDVLGSAPDEDVYRMKRLRQHRGRTISYFVNYYRTSVCGPLRKADVVRRSFVEVFQETSHVRLVRMVQRVEATVADMDLSRLLDVEFGAPLFFIENAYFSGKGEPVLVTHMHYRGDSYVYMAAIPLNLDPEPPAKALQARRRPEPITP